MEEVKLTDAQLTKALRCCAKGPGDLDGCRICTLEKNWEDADGEKCYDRLVLQAADRLEELAEENRRMRDATEGYVAELEKQMVHLARECNTAQERGVTGVAGDIVLALNQIQEKLVELGRTSVVAAEPVDGGWRVAGITVEWREVFRADAQEIATSPAAPRNDVLFRYLLTH